MRRKWGFVALVAAAAVLQASCMCWTCPKRAAKEGKEGFVLRVNAGMLEPYTDSAGSVWQPEKIYAERAPYGFEGPEENRVDRGQDAKIEGTNDPRIYQTERWLMTSFIAKVPNGKYTVKLHFAETYPDIATAGPRVFDVSIQGNVALKDFNVSQAAGGVQKAVVKTFEGIEVSDDTLKIGFAAKQQNPEINGIEILGR